MFTNNKLFIENLKSAIADQFKYGQHRENRTISLLDLKPFDDGSFLVTAKITFTNLEFNGVDNNCHYNYTSDMHLVVETILDKSNTTITETSPYTIDVTFNGNYDLKNITKQQYFNTKINKDNPYDSDLTLQDRIEKSIQRYPEQSVLNQKDLFKLKPFTIHMVYSD